MNGMTQGRGCVRTQIVYIHTYLPAYIHPYIPTYIPQQRQVAERRAPRLDLLTYHTRRPVLQVGRQVGVYVGARNILMTLLLMMVVPRRETVMHAYPATYIHIHTYLPLESPTTMDKPSDETAKAVGKALGSEGTGIRPCMYVCMYVGGRYVCT